jgi:hypothetical protein
LQITGECMATDAPDLIHHQQPAGRPLEPERARDDGRRLQPFATLVAADQRVPLRRWVQGVDDRPGVVQHREQLETVETVDLLVVDHQDVTGARRAESVAGVEVRRVRVPLSKQHNPSSGNMRESNSIAGGSPWPSDSLNRTACSLMSRSASSHWPRRRNSPIRPLPLPVRFAPPSRPPPSPDTRAAESMMAAATAPSPCSAGSLPARIRRACCYRTRWSPGVR